MRAVGGWFWITLVLVFAVALPVGCGGAKKKKPKPTEDEPALEIKKYEREPLVSLLDSATTIPFDGKKVEVLVPKDWKSPPALSDDSLMFYATDALKLPTIYVAVESWSDEKTATVTEENLKAFFAAIEARGKAKKLSYFKGDEPLPMSLGGRACIRYVIKDNEGSQRVRKQILCTAVEGRLYTVTLVVDTEEMLLKYRDAAYAVMPGMKFASAAGGNSPTTETKPDSEKKTDAGEKKQDAAEKPAK